MNENVGLKLQGTAERERAIGPSDVAAKASTTFNK